MADYLREHPGVASALRAGDRRALETVYWAYVDRVERALRHGFVVGPERTLVAAPAPDVADLVQETFLRAFSAGARASYDPARDYGAYLLTIARNALVDRLRRGRREVLVEVDDVDDAELAEPPTVDEWATPEVQAIVDRYLASLPPDLAAVHDARFTRGLPQREAAEGLGISRQTLRTREGHLREGLRRALASASEEPPREKK